MFILEIFFRIKGNFRGVVIVVEFGGLAIEVIEVFIFGEMDEKNVVDFYYGISCRVRSNYYILLNIFWC